MECHIITYPVSRNRLAVRYHILLLLWLTSHICLVPTQMLYVNITVFTPLNVENVSSWRNNLGFSPHFVNQMDTYIG